MGFYSKNLSHLGLVAGMFDYLELGQQADKYLPSQSAQQFLSNGQCVKALILNGLGFVERRLYLTADFFKDKPIEHLLGAGISLEMLNDDRLGRCLDTMYAFGVSELFSLLSAHACQRLGIDKQIQFRHLDSTSFHVDGQYSAYGNDEDADCISVVEGYSRDHRPDLKQVMLNMVVEQSAGIPLMMEALSGNTSDKKSFRALITRFIKSLKQGGERAPVCWVADSALYCQETLQAISGHVRWITRVPETLLECKDLLEDIDTSAMQCFSDKKLSKYRYTKVCSTYAGVKQVWLVVFSQDAYTRELKSLHKQYLKATEEAHKDFEKLGRQIFSCQTDAQKALNTWLQKQKYLSVEDAAIVPVCKHQASGRPQQGQSPKVVGFQIQGNPCCPIATYQHCCKTKGLFVIASNEIEGAFTDDQVLLAYKTQNHVEKGFRFMKDKQFMASTLFIKKPERLEAILMIMALCLLVYASLERELRQQLQKQQQTLPNQVKKQVQNPTMRWIFAIFTGIHCLYMKDEQKFTILNLNDLHLKILNLLANDSLKYYKLE